MRTAVAGLLFAVTVATWMVGRGPAALLYLLLYALVVLPGLPLGFALFGRRHPAGWIAGIAVVPAGNTFPYAQDPRDSNIRIAPSFPSIEEVEQAAEGIALCTLLAASEKVLEGRRG